MAQREKVLWLKSDDLSSILGTYIKWSDRLDGLHVHTCTPASMATHPLSIIMNVFLRQGITM